MDFILAGKDIDPSEVAKLPEPDPGFVPYEPREQHSFILEVRNWDGVLVASYTLHDCTLDLLAEGTVAHQFPVPGAQLTIRRITAGFGQQACDCGTPYGEHLPWCASLR